MLSTILIMFLIVWQPNQNNMLWPLFTLVFGCCWVSLYLHRSFICMCVCVWFVCFLSRFVILHRSFCWCGVCKSHWHAHLKQNAWFLCRQTVLSVSCTVLCATAGRQQGSHRGAVNKNSHISLAPGSGSESSCRNVVSTVWWCVVLLSVKHDPYHGVCIDHLCFMLSVCVCGHYINSAY